jgi:hypothetical protein
MVTGSPQIFRVRCLIFGHNAAAFEHPSIDWYLKLTGDRGSMPISLIVAGTTGFAGSGPLEMTKDGS